VGIDGNAESNHLFWTQVYENLKLAWSKVARRYDANRKPHQYRVGDTVVFRLNVDGSRPRILLPRCLSDGLSQWLYPR
jgi:hypothetical protein